MRTTIEIDEHLMAQVQKSGGYKTKRETEEAGLNLSAKLKAQEGMKKLRGKIRWEGDLDEIRRD